jgi:hypothetical protein
MEFDPKRAARVDVKRRRNRTNEKDIKRQLQQRDWFEEETQEEVSEQKE